MKYNLVGFSEIDKYAVQSYCALHGVDESLNLGDITKVNKINLPDFDLLVGGSPCQDFSTSGQKEGAIWTCNVCNHKYNPLGVRRIKRGNCPKCHESSIDRTRSSLIVELLDIVAIKRPKLFIYENVKTLMEEGRYLTLYNKFLNELEELGYNTYYKILNAKGFGIPQQRERLFLLCIRKDVDTGLFKFPEEQDIGVRVKDFLEPHSTKKNYLGQDKIDNFVTTLEGRPESTYKDIIQGYHKYPESNKRHQSNTVYWIEGLSPTIATTKQPKFIEVIDGQPLIRNTTPLECWRLMGFSKEDFIKAKEQGMSNQQLYKQAGNSIVVNVLEVLFNELHIALPEVFNDGISVLSTFSGIGAFESALDRIGVNKINEVNFSEKHIENVLEMKETLYSRIKVLEEELAVDKKLLIEVKNRYKDLTGNIIKKNKELTLKKQIMLYYKDNISINLIEQLTGARKEYIYQVASEYNKLVNGVNGIKGKKTKERVQEYLNENLKPSEIAKRMKISRQYVYKIIKSIKEDISNY